jgi:ariadne-1
MHYYERWAEHGASHVRAVAQLAAVNLEALSAAQQTPVSQLAFVKEAMRQIVACRRTLKWTYAFGYYSFGGDAPGAAARKQFFEYAQGEAEQQLERLTAAVEGHGPDELQHFFDSPAPPKLFDDLRSRLAGLTSVTAKYFDALVAELERGLPAVGAPEEGGAGGEEGGGEGGASGSGDGGAEGGGAAEAPAPALAAAQAAAAPRCVRVR